MDVVSLRLASPADAPVIAAILRAAFAEYAPLYTPQAFAATTPSAERIITRLGEGPIWVAEWERVIVGTLGANPQSATLYLRGMAVLPAARGRQIGQALLLEADTYAGAHAHKLLVLSTTPFLNRAIRLYEQAGFRRDVSADHDLFGTPLWTMIKTRPPG